MAMEQSPAPEGLPPSLRFLKLLVTTLTATLIIGLITIIALLVIRLPGRVEPVALPEMLELPEGARPAAITQGRGWIAVVTEDDRILIFDRDGRIKQEVRVAP
jgi:Flp pilus assembly protein protease CpaA